MAYKLIARNQNLPDHIRYAIEGKRSGYGPPYQRPGKLVTSFFYQSFFHLKRNIF